MRSAVALVSVLALSACSEPGPPATPPEGWVAAGDTRWFVPGTDTTAAFRDLSTIEAMGVAREGPEYLRWVQEKMTDIYRTSPEVVDSVFAADYLAEVERGVPAGEGYEQAATALADSIKRSIFQRYNATRYMPPAEPMVVPDSLADASGRIAVQVYVNPDKEPVAVKLVEGTGTALDQVFMRRAIDSEYTDAWVRRTAGRSQGFNIPNWAFVSSEFAR